MRIAPENKLGRKDWRVRLGWLLLILILLFVFASIILVPTLLTVSVLENAPYSLHSVLNADYSADTLALKYSQVKSDIIAQVIKDQYGLMLGSSSGDPAFGPQIAMTTPFPGLPGTPTMDYLQPSTTTEPFDGVASPTVPNNDLSPTQGIIPTSTSPLATHNPPNTTLVATITGPNPTWTQQPTTTQPPNSTPIPPTHAVPSATQGPISTSIAPTRTVAPTSQPPTPTSPLPTSTPMPPTRTPAPTPRPPTNTPRPTQPPDPYPPPPTESTPYP
jgi:hypothetical protein